VVVCALSLSLSDCDCLSACLSACIYLRFASIPACVIFRYLIVS
jgi:hypothetical protein